MPRTKGAKDKKPRTMNPNSLAMIRTMPGYISVCVRCYGKEGPMRQLAAMTTDERGDIFTKAIEKDGR